MRVCTCGAKESEERPFYAKSAVCRECYKAKKREPTRIRQASVRWRTVFNQRTKIRRTMPEYRAKFILQDSRKSDHRSGRENDLDRSFVEGLLLKPCLYCGDTSLQRTLDRIDNKVGHTKTNVVPCCVRCNYLRRDMPFAAWERLAPEIRKIREAGLFGDWVGGVRLRKGKPMGDGTPLEAERA